VSEVREIFSTGRSGQIREEGTRNFIPELPELPVDSRQECSVIPASRDPGGPESWWRSGRFFNRELGEIGEDGNKEFIPELPELPVDSGQECSVIPASRDPGGPESWWRSGRFFNRELGEIGEDGTRNSSPNSQSSLLIHDRNAA
jgi:hypothetical protein